MSELDDNIEDLDSSSGLADDGNAALSASPEAASSAVTGENDELDLLSVVRDVVKDRPVASETASPAAEDSEETDKAEQPDGEENFDDVPFNQHPRFKKLIRERSELKVERDRYKVDADRYDSVVQFLDVSGLSAEEAADGLATMGLMKTNPAEAWRRLQPTLQKLIVAAGEVPSPELQARVNAGELSAAAALEISRAQAEANSVRTAREWETKRGELVDKRDQSTSIVDAVADWEAERTRKDPNFADKQPLMEREVAWLLTKEGRPTTAAGIRDQLKRAYDSVNKAYRPPAPPVVRDLPKPVIKPVTGGQISGNPQPAGKSMSTLDIIRANRRA